MLIRIGDEKRELIDAHLGVLKNKFADLLTQNDEEMVKESVETLRSVIENMPHKTLIYSSLIALLATSHAPQAQSLFNQVITPCLTDSLVSAQDGFKSRNVFRWLGYLTELKVLSSSALCKLCSELMQNSNVVQGDLAAHCVLVALTTEGVISRMTTECKSDLDSLNQSLTTYFQGRTIREKVKNDAL